MNVYEKKTLAKIENYWSVHGLSKLQWDYYLVVRLFFLIFVFLLSKTTTKPTIIIYTYIDDPIFILRADFYHIFFYFLSFLSIYQPFNQEHY